MKIKQFLSIVFLLCLSLFANEKQKLILAVNPYKTTPELQVLHAELIDYLEKALKREIVFVVSKDYNNLITLIEQGSVDIASISPKLFATLRLKDPTIPYLASIKFADAQGNVRSSYRSLIVTLSDSSIRTFADLKGKSFGFTDVDSTSGYLYPRFMMRQNGIDPAKELGKIYMLKKHPKVIQALLEKSIDVGALYDGIYRGLSNAEQKKIRILATSEEIPHDVMIASKQMDEALVTKIRALLLAFHSTPSSSSSIAGFEEKSLFLYDRLRDLE
ncbi:MAG: phosphate/phosphite/phosphonate ABC transporter substrate-binding protein [Sulfurospirillaceae bacterium]|nr:phosphate/phosphite/phosphonate ABC transporter substrate-binding protein [Sulfurospirillaceae bacterium]